MTAMPNNVLLTNYTYSLTTLLGDNTAPCTLVTQIAISYLSYDVRGFQFPNGFYVLFYGSIMVPFAIQMIPILAKNTHKPFDVILLALSYPEI